MAFRVEATKLYNHIKVQDNENLVIKINLKTTCAVVISRKISYQNKAARIKTVKSTNSVPSNLTHEQLYP
jgi:hypothetical protein